MVFANKLFLSAAVLFSFQSFAGPVHISFLSDKTALLETLRLLRANGCGEEGIGVFQKVVERYYSTPFQLNLSKFPKPQNGFYSFETTSEILQAFPHALSLTSHEWDFNCFDTVIVASSGRLVAGSHPDDICGVFLAPAITTNYSLINQPVATARDAFNFNYPSDYRNSELIPPSMAERRISLTAALYSNHVLPSSINREGLADAVLKTLQVNWKRQGIKFPKKFEIVLCHAVHLPSHQFSTRHAGLLFARQDGYTYLEKDSGNGPFVRLDFDNRSDLNVWLSSKAGKQRQGTFLVASFNDAKVEMLHLEYE